MELFLLVKPRSRKNEIFPGTGGRHVVKITAPAYEGKANAMLLEYLSDVLNVPRMHMEIKSGASGHYKRVSINAEESYIRERLAKYFAGKTGIK